jgi:hypothetical protein
MVLRSAAATSVAVVAFPNSGWEVPTVPGFSSIAVIFVLLGFSSMLVPSLCLVDAHTRQ